MNGIVVSDTSPVRALNNVGHLALLAQLFDAVLVPPAVARELTTPRHRQTVVDMTTLANATIVRPANLDLVQQLRSRLDFGESEAIALAIERRCGLLIDEHDGRTLALQHKIEITGTAGILLEAKKRRLIAAVHPLLNALRSQYGFFLSDPFMARILREAGE